MTIIANFAIENCEISYTIVLTNSNINKKKLPEGNRKRIFLLEKSSSQFELDSQKIFIFILFLTDFMASLYLEVSKNVFK